MERRVSLGSAGHAPRGPDIDHERHPMIRPKRVLFDLGKVLVDFDWLIAGRRMAEQARATPDEIVRFITTSDAMVDFEKGLIAGDGFFQAARQALGYRGSADEFRLAFSDIFSEIEDMVRLQARVREAGFPTWIMSNTNDWAVAHIRERFGFFSSFDGYFLSYQLGALKPQPAIYEAAEKTTGCRGAEILYIDDIAENTSAAAARGWQVIHHLAPGETIAGVERILGLNAPSDR
jgi:FMN phosphatase YigB (HAD superfamily)